MLNTLNFQLTVPTAFHFMARYLKAAGAEKNQSLLAAYLVELALPDYSNLKYPGSLLAAAAVLASNRVMCRPSWTNALARHSRYSEGEVVPVALAMVRAMSKASTASLAAVYKKYSNQKFLEVAKTHIPSELLNEANASAADF